MIISSFITENGIQFIERKSSQNFYIRKINETGFYEVARDLLTKHYEYIETNISIPEAKTTENKEVN